MEGLITSFEPFAGRTKNSSMEIADAVCHDLRTRFPDWHLTHLNSLPVVYDAAASQILRWNASQPIKPRFVLALGEGRDTLRIETAANNLDDCPSLADNNGEFRFQSPIDRAHGSRVGLWFPAHTFYEAAQALGYIESLDSAKGPMVADKTAKPVAVSISPGFFICNNTAFRLAIELKQHNIPFIFLHVPRSDQRPLLSYEACAQIIADGLATCMADHYFETWIHSTAPPYPCSTEEWHRQSQAHQELTSHPFWIALGESLQEKIEMGVQA